MTEAATTERMKLIDLDDERYINRTRLAKLLAVPLMDVSVGTCYSKCLGYTRYGHQMIDRIGAIRDMQAYYTKMYMDNKSQFLARHSEMYRDNALKYKARLETCNMMLEALTKGGDADG